MKFTGLFGSSLLLLVLMVSVLTPLSAHALIGSDFQPGRIMDDAVFFDSDSMTPQDIQTFLNSKVPVCDTYGTLPYRDSTRASWGELRGYPPPYTCLKDKIEPVSGVEESSGLCAGIPGGTKTAAQMIHDVAVACGINPQVLIVLLQKEQSLITDDWPWESQYQYATGYACPDSAPCDPSYSGLYNQLYMAARQFKRYTVHSEWFNYQANRTRFIHFNPNMQCGGTDVFIENQATAALYNYTPYQPNQAALSNLYGTGDMCSSYGNRNFWRLFNDWFGSTLAEQPILPSVNIDVNGKESVVVDYGSMATLNWSSENAVSCRINNNHLTSSNGQQILINLTDTTTYTFTCTNTNGSSSDTASITVNPPTFSYLLSYLSGVSGDSNRIQSTSQHVTNAVRFRETNEIEKANKSLDTALKDFERHVQQGNATADQLRSFTKAIADLKASWL